MNEKYILLAEDNKDDVELTRRALSKSCVTNKMSVVSDGREALDFLFCRGQYAGRNPCENPAFMLLDLKMPFIDGLEVLRQIRADQRTQAFPVILLSSSIDEKDRVESLRLGANGFECKPVSFNEFVELIQRLCSLWLKPD